MKALKDAKGFTLIELLVVVAIIGILAAIAIPQFAEYRQKGFDSQANSDLRNAATSEEAYFATENIYKSCTSAAACASILPGLEVSGSTLMAMTANGAVSFTGTARSSKGTPGKTFTYNSALGGMQ